MSAVARYLRGALATYRAVAPTQTTTHNAISQA